MRSVTTRRLKNSAAAAAVKKKTLSLLKLNNTGLS
jgi:hypothetical protein